MKILFYFKKQGSLKLKNLAGIESLNLALFTRIKKLNHDTYFVNSFSKNILKKKWDCVISSNSAKIFDKVTSKKNILWLHNKLQIEKAIRKNEFFSILKNSISVVFNSAYLKNNTSNFYNFRNKTIIPNFLTSEFQKKKRKYKRKPCFVWSVQRKKGLDNIIDLWIQKINPNNKNFNFYIFGLHDSTTKKYNLNNLKKYNIFFKGRVNKKILIKYYLNSMGMICLGYDETFALNVIEGFSCGLPMITFGYTAVGELVNNKNSFILNDYDNLEHVLIRIVNLNSVQRNKVSNYCVKFSKNYFFDKIISKWIKIIGLRID